MRRKLDRLTLCNERYRMSSQNNFSDLVRLRIGGGKAMDQRATPSPRIAPLPPDPALNEQFEASKKSLGFIPNSLLIMQRKPKMVQAWAQMSAAVWDPESKVERGFKRLLAHVASRAAGCQYCMAHTVEGAMHFGVAEQKAAAVWDYQRSPLYTESERVALDVAVAAASVPNAVTDEM